METYNQISVYEISVTWHYLNHFSVIQMILAFSQQLDTVGDIVMNSKSLNLIYLLYNKSNLSKIKILLILKW